MGSKAVGLDESTREKRCGPRVQMWHGGGRALGEMGGGWVTEPKEGGLQGGGITAWSNTVRRENSPSSSVSRSHWRWTERVGVRGMEGNADGLSVRMRKERAPCQRAVSLRHLAFFLLWLGDSTPGQTLMEAVCKGEEG